MKPKFTTSTRLPIPRGVLSFGLLGALLTLASCSSKSATEVSDESPQNGFVPNGTGGTGGAGAQHNVSQGDIVFTGDSIDNCKISVEGATCVGTKYEPEYTPLDIYVMLDQTGSMCSCVDPPKVGNPCPDPSCNATRLDAIRQAMSQFMGDPNSAGIGVGIGYFGQFPIGSANCEDSAYAAPAVTVQLLPNSAPGLMTSLNSVAPTGETPTGAAIRGACSYAKTWKQAHTTHKVVMLLVTDGLPEAPMSCPSAGCCPTLDDAASAAQGCLNGNPGIQTYVLGVGPYLDNLNLIAAAGGTNSAYLVGSGDVASQVLQALNAIRGAAFIPCSLKIPPAPPGQQISYDQVNIAYADATCHGTIYPYVKSADACGSDVGWYYDNDAAPSSVQLCPTSCNQVSTAGARLMFTLGCQTVSGVVVN
jgi:hypothetical protein